jgi:hypothetical protein
MCGEKRECNETPSSQLKGGLTRAKFLEFCEEFGVIDPDTLWDSGDFESRAEGEAYYEIQDLKNNPTWAALFK